MANAYYSTVFEQPAGDLWRVVRDFGNYALWVDGAGTETMESGRAPDSVGAARVIELADRTIVQRLTGFSDADRRYRYTFEGGSPAEIDDYEAILSITPITADDRSFVQWTAAFDCPPDRRDHWQDFYREAFAGWLDHLRRSLEA